MNFQAKDCSPLYPQPATKEDVDWLRRLSTKLCAESHILSISNIRNESEPIIYCDWEGYWRAGRYIGSISYEGRQITIMPRLGLDALKSWLFEAASVTLTEAPGFLEKADSFIAELLALVWVQGLVQAARHGLPRLRKDVQTSSATLKGRIDVPASLRSIAAKGSKLTSIYSVRSLDHAVADVIIAAYNVLRKSFANERWLPPRAQELLPHIIAATGARPPVPSKAELERIRYTPITIGFRAIAELSHRIANKRGLTPNVDTGGETYGVLLDIAELWELTAVRQLAEEIQLDRTFLV